MHLPSPRYSLDTQGIRTGREVAILQPLYDSKPEGYPLPLEDAPAVAGSVPLFVYHARFHNKSL